MSNTIDLLERIGQDANLRYASADELAKLLARAGMSEACQTAVITGDTSLLAGELRQPVKPLFHHSQTPAHEEQEQQEQQREPQPEQDTPSQD